MSVEAWGDEGDIGPEGYITDDRATEFMIGAAQVMREMLARFVEQGGDATKQHRSGNWIPSWGKDPGKWEGEIPADIWSVA